MPLYNMSSHQTPATIITNVSRTSEGLRSKKTYFVNISGIWNDHLNWVRREFGIHSLRAIKVLSDEL